MRATKTCLCLILFCGTAFGQGGKPFEGADEVEKTGVWDFTKPLWVLFAQERFLVPESPEGEWIPRAALAHYKPVGENKRWFFIIAFVAYLANVHWEQGGFENEASVFTMLMPVGSSVYRNGTEVPGEEMDTVWTDTSLRAAKTWGDRIRFRLAAEYELAWRGYEPAENTDPTFVLPYDTFVNEFDLTAALDTRSRGRTGDYNGGLEVEVGAAYEIRNRWNAWGVGGTEYTDPAAKRATTLFGSLEFHQAFDERDAFVFHAKLRLARGWDLDRLTYIRLGGGGFGRQFDRVGAGSTGAANDGELLRSDGVPGFFGGEYMTDRYGQLNFEMDFPASQTSRLHFYGAGARFVDLLEAGTPWKTIYGFGLGYTKVNKTMTRGFRVDVGYSPVAERKNGSADFTFTYLQLF